MKNNILWVIIVSALVGGLTSYIVVKKVKPQEPQAYVYNNDKPSKTNVNVSNDYPEFTYTAEMSVKAVVYVKVVKKGVTVKAPTSLFEYFFGYGGGMQREQVGSGSGVIISDDGYIVTNNHVVSGATDIEVTLENNKTFKAALVGTDEATDVAIIKIDAQNLPSLPFGDSDNLRLGEWVLAIGSPFGLMSTVTAGIVSAKGRQMQESSNPGELRIESFIQTDAAVNPGNSGGALVNIKGELVGINTAIISNTGSYAGYSFAVPVNIVKKISDDFIHYGSVQRAVLGVSMQNISQDFMTKYRLATMDGVYVAEISRDGAADKAGIRRGDILVSINGQKVTSTATVQEIINKYRPGDIVSLEVIRGTDHQQYEASLMGR